MASILKCSHRLLYEGIEGKCADSPLLYINDWTKQHNDRNALRFLGF